MSPTIFYHTSNNLGKFSLFFHVTSPTIICYHTSNDLGKFSLPSASCPDTTFAVDRALIFLNLSEMGRFLIRYTRGSGYAAHKQISPSDLLGQIEFVVKS